MTEISDSLQCIDAKLESIASMIAGDQRAKVKNATDIARTYAALHDDYLQKPAEARQAARNEIEGRYNDVGQVIDWITEQLAGIEDKAGTPLSAKKTSNRCLKRSNPTRLSWGCGVEYGPPVSRRAPHFSTAYTHCSRSAPHPLFPVIFVPN